MLNNTQRKIAMDCTIQILDAMSPKMHSPLGSAKVSEMVETVFDTVIKLLYPDDSAE